MSQYKKPETQEITNNISAGDVIKLYSQLDNLGINIWIDGGWGVDALLGKQTRLHSDVDIVTQQKDVSKLRDYLAASDYKDIPRDDTSSWNFVLGNNNGHEVDIHVITLDGRGNGLYGPLEKGIMYPASSLTGSGTINGQTVRCISAEDMVKFHSGYKLKEKDFKDISALCEKFDLELPSEYAHLRDK